MTDIAAFLNARLDEDEAIARAVDDNSAPFDGQWKNDNNVALRTYNDWVLAYKPNAEPWRTGVLDHIARHDPARVLAEVATKRAIVGLWRHADAAYQRDEYDPEQGAAESALSDVLVHLALPYADHPDYDESWRP